MTNYRERAEAARKLLRGAALDNADIADELRRSAELLDELADAADEIGEGLAGVDAALDKDQPFGDGGDRPRDKPRDKPRDRPRGEPRDEPGDDPDIPDDPPVIEPGGNTVRLYHPLKPDDGGWVYFEFMAPSRFSNMRCVERTWGDQGGGRTWHCHGRVKGASGTPDPGGEFSTYSMADVEPGPPLPDKLPKLRVTAVDVEGVTHEELVGPAGKTIAGVRVHVFPELHQPGVLEYQLHIESQEDQYLASVSVELPGRAEIFDPENPDGDGELLWSDDGHFALTDGCTTLRRFLVGRDLGDEVMRSRYRDWTHFGVLIGPDGYESGGYGPHMGPLPRLKEEDVGYDVHSARNKAGLERADQIRKHIIGRTGAPGFEHKAGLGALTPYDQPYGGGTGGSGITPYWGWGRTPGELAELWLKLRCIGERMPRGYYKGYAFPPETPAKRLGYERELCRFQPYDTAHLIRALGPAVALVWLGGSPAAARFIRSMAERKSAPTPYDSKFDGKGHKYAKRDEGWVCYRISTAFAVTPPEDPWRSTWKDHAVAQRDKLLRVAMPNGITHRAYKKGGDSPFSANLNPDPFLVRKGPKEEDTMVPQWATCARSIFVAIVSYGASAMDKAVFGGGSMELLYVRAADAWFSDIDGQSAPSGANLDMPSTPKGHIMVAGKDLDSPVMGKPAFSYWDDSNNVWECQWALVAAYSATKDTKYLERPCQIAGHKNLAGWIANEYKRTGSKQAWWAHTPEGVAWAQLLFDEMESAG